MACTDCNDTNVPEVDNTPLECCELISDKCVVTSAAVPCLQIGKGWTLAQVLQRLCSNLGGGGTPVTVEAGDNITVDETTDSSGTTYTVNAVLPQKDVFYEEFISPLNISQSAPSPGPGQYHFPTGYEVLTYQNTSGNPITVEVHGSYNTFMFNQGVVGPIAENLVNGAIIKTDALGNNTIGYEDIGLVDIEGYLFDSNGDTVSQVTDESVVTTPSGLPVNFRFLTHFLDQNKSIFKVLTLDEDESVSLMFKTKGGGTSAGLRSAQILVKEL